MEDREASSAAGGSLNDGTNRSNNTPTGIRSGEICVRVLGESLYAPTDGAVHGLAPAIIALALAPPTLQQMMAPSTHKREHLRQRRVQIQERRRLVRQRVEATRAAIDAMAVNPDSVIREDRVRVSATVTAMTRYTTACHALAQLYTTHAMHGALQYYALLEEERAWITAWQTKEAATCHELTRTAKRRHHITSFAVHLESETSGQIRLWRLSEGDAQRARCLKAASENLKKGFFHGVDARIHVQDVYKIDNRPLLGVFEQWIAHHTSVHDTNATTKVKGLFCSVPVESLERCVAWVSTNVRDATDEAPGTQRRFIAHERVLEATAMPFPRRFSRYSTLNELRDAPANDLKMADTPSRYLALCRVAMGKTQRVAATYDNQDPKFPANASIASMFFSDEEEYAVRYPEAVVPEFLVEYRFEGTAKGKADTPESRIIPVRLSSVDCEPLPSTLFEASARKVLDNLQQPRSPVPVPDRPSSLLNANIPPVFSSPSRSANTPPIDREEPSTEKVLEMCGRRRRQYADDMQRLRGLLWDTTKAAWDTLDLTTKQARHRLTNQDSDEASRRTNEDARLEGDVKHAGRKQSLKAKKLYGELALERQLHAADVTRLDALVKGKLNINGKLKKKDGVANKPRPFR